MEQIAITLAASAVYAAAISTGIGRKLAEEQVTLPIVVAGGVLIVLTGYSWGDWQQFADLLLWFALCALPLLVRAAVLHVQEQEQARVERYSVRQIEHADFSEYDRPA